MKFIRKYKNYIFIVLGILIVIICFILKFILESESKVEVIESNEVMEIEKQEEVKEEKVHVEIKGEVVNPGVYEIESYKRIIDVINMAGGLTDNSDTSLINLAKKITDEMVIIIYSKEEVKSSKIENSIIKIIEKECVCPEINNDGCLDNVTSEEIEENTDKISLNEATLEELMTVPNIGETKAKAIIEYRNTIGKFKSIEELNDINGIGDATYEKIKVYFKL